ncbi:MAG: NADH-quinone oxidoreductase subunit NuoH [Acidimicrobiales bacterium]
MLAGLDPLFLDGVGLSEVIIVLVKAVITLVALLVAVMLMVWFERKLVSYMQNRIGPNRAGPFGILQTLADGIKLFFKEDLNPEKADRFVFKLAPYLSLVPAFLTFAIVPIGGNFADKDGVVEIFGHRTFLQLADPPIGVLLFLAMSSMAIYGIMLAGWSSGSKYPLLGSVRASAQMISYEAALGLAIATVFLQSRSLSTHDIVAQQAGAGFWGVVPNWNIIVTGFVPFIVFMIAATAELNRPPFDLVEAEQELVGGFHTEYSGMRFAMFFLAEFMNTITMSAIIVTLFFGGPSGPILVDAIDWFWPPLWFFLKVFVFLFTFVWFRATLPRFRYDQLMDLGWKVLIPISLLWFLFLASRNVAADRNWNWGLVVLATIAIAVIGGALLLGAINKAKTDRDRQDVNA